MTLPRVGAYARRNVDGLVYLVHEFKEVRSTALPGNQVIGRDARIERVGVTLWVDWDELDAVLTLDAEEWKHLYEWAERNTWTKEEGMRLAEKMVDYLQSLVEEDARYMMNEGWTRVYERMFEARGGE